MAPDASSIARSGVNKISLSNGRWPGVYSNPLMSTAANPVPHLLNVRRPSSFAGKLDPGPPVRRFPVQADHNLELPFRTLPFVIGSFSTALTLFLGLAVRGYGGSCFSIPNAVLRYYCDLEPAVIESS